MARRMTATLGMPAQRPSTCEACPLLGRRPKDELPHGCRKTHVCLLTWRYLSGRGTKTLQAQGRCTPSEYAREREQRGGAYLIGIPMARQFGVTLPGDEQTYINFNNDNQ